MMVHKQQGRVLRDVVYSPSQLDRRTDKQMKQRMKDRQETRDAIMNLE